MQQNSRWLLAYLLAATGQPAVAEDLLQEVFRIAIEKQATFDPARPLGAWLRGIARNVLKRHYQEMRRSPQLVPLESLEETASELAAEDLDPFRMERYQQALAACLGRLTARVRQLVQRHYLEEVGLQHLARQAGLSATHVGVLLFRARKTLRLCIASRLAREGGAP